MAPVNPPWRWGVANVMLDNGPHAGRHAFRPACNATPKCVDYDPETVVPADRPLPSWVSRIEDDPVAGVGADGPETVTPWTADYRPPPAHYQAEGMDPWQIWEAFDLDPWSAALVKYVCRAGRKPGEPRLKDLLKARDYLAYLIEREERRDS
jgi:hypothetical protein